MYTIRVAVATLGAIQVPLNIRSHYRVELANGLITGSPGLGGFATILSMGALRVSYGSYPLSYRPDPVEASDQLTA
jgi:hypothetical protein